MRVFDVVIVSMGSHYVCTIVFVCSVCVCVCESMVD
jgi:hypothetical protein